MSELLPQLVFSTKAIAHVQTIMQGHEAPLGFRLSIKKTGCSGYMYQPSIITELSDKNVEVLVEGGLRVFVDKACVELINGTEVDFVQESLGQNRLVFKNPRAVSLCGCGESFNLTEDEE